MSLSVKLGCTFWANSTAKVVVSEEELTSAAWGLYHNS